MPPLPLSLSRLPLSAVCTHWGSQEDRIGCSCATAGGTRRRAAAGGGGRGRVVSVHEITGGGGGGGGGGASVEWQPPSANNSRKSSVSYSVKMGLSGSWGCCDSGCKRWRCLLPAEQPLHWASSGGCRWLSRAGLPMGGGCHRVVLCWLSALAPAGRPRVCCTPALGNRSAAPA